jgi:predicted aconitase with swiveling domain
MRRSGAAIEGVALVSGRASGRSLVLAEPLSFWGGVDASTGTIVDTHHPQVGQSIVGRILVLSNGRGSSSSSSVLAEAIRNAVGPAAIVLGVVDPIIALGCQVAYELYGASVPVVVVEGTGHAACAGSTVLRVEADTSRALVRIVQ